jgi:GDP/UDP-N,N'-diacetylbacillosamine 2-epimerase (hydrolysing)
MASRRRILVVTGKRGGFGAMKPMLRALANNPDVELQLVATDQHLDPRFGCTILEVIGEFQIAGQVPMRQRDDSGAARAEALGNCVIGMAQLFEKLRPDLCVLYGDRGESLATALVATTMNVPIAHIQGGDVSGSVDEWMRHAITKLAQIHFPSVATSADRIARMGEEEWRIHTVGDSHLDCIAAGEYADAAAVAKEFDLDISQPVLVVLQHSETTAPADAYAQMHQTLLAVRDTGHQAVVIYPCSDVGYDGIIRAIRELGCGPQFRIRQNIAAPLFLGLLKVSAVLIGNSSAGLIETPTLHIPAINIGRRQAGRLCAENVIHIDHDRRSIAAAIETALSPAFRDVVAGCSQPYGNGRTGEQIAGILAKVPIDGNLLIKRMSY